MDFIVAQILLINTFRFSRKLLGYVTYAMSHTVLFIYNDAYNNPLKDDAYKSKNGSVDGQDNNDNVKDQQANGCEKDGKDHAKFRKRKHENGND